MTVASRNLQVITGRAAREGARERAKTNGRDEKMALWGNPTITARRHYILCLEAVRRASVQKPMAATKKWPCGQPNNHSTEANPNGIKHLAAKGERVAIENGSWPGGPLREYFFR